MESKDKYNVVFSLNAHEELDHILNTLEIIYSKQLAIKLFDELYRRLEYLKFFPEMFNKSNYQFHGRILRKIPVKGYIILYTTDHQRKEVIIIGIFSELEDIDSKF